MDGFRKGLEDMILAVEYATNLVHPCNNTIRGPMGMMSRSLNFRVSGLTSIQKAALRLAKPGVATASSMQDCVLMTTVEQVVFGSTRTKALMEAAIGVAKWWRQSHRETRLKRSIQKAARVVGRRTQAPDNNDDIDDMMLKRALTACQQAVTATRTVEGRQGCAILQGTKSK